MPKDIVYPFRPGPRDSVALRYSLRSLANIPHRRVWIVGKMPPWVKGVGNIRTPDNTSVRGGKGKHLNVWNKLAIICNHPDISSDFYLFNDDFIILQPVEEFPYYNRGELHKENQGTSAYTFISSETAKLFDEPLNYELHCPFVYNKKRLSGLFSLYNVMAPLLHRSLYGNHYKIQSTYLADNKIATTDELKESFKSGVSFVSLSNPLEGQRMLHRILQREFPNPSRYEK